MTDRDLFYLKDSVSNYLFCRDELKLNYEFNELNFSKGIKNYDRLRHRLTEIKLPNVTKFKYSKMSLEELKEFLESILNKILGNEFHNEIKSIINSIILDKIKDPFDSVASQTYIPEENKYILRNIILSGKLVSVEGISATHEAGHILLLPYATHDYNRVVSNHHYNELLSILLEYIACYELSNIYKQDNLMDKHNILRIKHNQDQSLEDISTDNVKANMHKLRGMPNLEFMKIYLEYEKHNAFSYIVGDIYANKLFEYYLDDPETLISFIIKLLKGETSINEILKYYNLNLQNGSAMDSYNLKLQKIERNEIHV